jgi:VirE N-terminal domain
MSEILQAPVSLFDGSTNTTPVDTVPLATALQRIQDGTYRGFVEQLRHTLATRGEAVYKAAKRRSHAFAPTGTFTVRNNASLETPSGCLNFDLDHVPDLPQARARLGQDPHLVYLFISPSGLGLKFGMAVSGYRDDATYRCAWLAVERYLVATYPDLAVNNDPQCKAVSTMCYMSYDPALAMHPHAVPFVVPPPPPPAPKPMPGGRRAGLPLDRYRRYGEQAIATAITILDASVDGIRDRQRLKASRLLGGYIAGGVLSEAEAKAGIAAAVERNTTKPQRAWRVIARGLGYGEAAPITLEQLEADYDQWRQAHPARQGPPSSDTPEPSHAPCPPIVHHVLPDYLLHHPDPRVRTHWQRIYRKTARLKERYARQGGLLCPK